MGFFKNGKKLPLSITRIFWILFWIHAITNAHSLPHRKRNEKLDWMYAGPQVNHEEYLLGRKIDKNVEILKEEEDKPVRTFYFNIYMFNIEEDLDNEYIGMISRAICSNLKTMLLCKM